MKKYLGLLITACIIIPYYIALIKKDISIITTRLKFKSFKFEYKIEKRTCLPADQTSEPESNAAEKTNF